MTKTVGTPRLFALEALPDGGGHLLQARVADPRLRARQPATATAVAHPGTVAVVAGTLFEVVDIAAGRSPFAVCYRLQPFDAQETIRQVVDLSPPGLDRFEHELRSELTRRARLRNLTLLLPLVGLLPQDRQEALEREVGLDALRASRISALALFLPTLAIATYGNMAFVVDALGSSGHLPLVPGWLLLASDYFLFESVYRLRAVNAVGSGPVALLLRVAEETGLLARIPDPARERERRDAELRASAHLVDRVVRMPARGGQGSELRIESAVDRAWRPGQILSFDGSLWRIEGADPERIGGRATWVYRLLPATPHDLAHTPIPYRPDQRLVELREGRMRDLAEQLALLAPLFGSFPGELQVRWAERHGFDARRATLYSAALELVLALPLLQGALQGMALFPGIRALLALVAMGAGFHLLEGLLRLVAVLREGRPSGMLVFAWTPYWRRFRARFAS